MQIANPELEFIRLWFGNKTEQPLSVVIHNEGKSRDHHHHHDHDTCASGLSLIVLQLDESNNFSLHAIWVALEPSSLDLKQTNVPRIRLSSRISIASDNGYFWSCRFFCWRISFNFQKMRHHSYSRGEYTVEHNTIVRLCCMEEGSSGRQCNAAPKRMPADNRKFLLLKT